MQPKVTRGSILTGKRPQPQSSGFQVPDAPAEAPKLNKRQSKASAKKKEAEEAAQEEQANKAEKPKKQPGRKKQNNDEYITKT